MIVTVDLTGDKRIIKALKKFPEKLFVNLRTAAIRERIRIVSIIKQEKLSGQVLNRRTGRLSRSVRHDMQIKTGEELTVNVSANVEYARIHEYGFQGRIDVTEHQRRSSTGKITTVAAHSRNVNFPERSYMRSTLGEEKDRIVSTFVRAINRTLKENGL